MQRSEITPQILANQLDYVDGILYWKQSRGHAKQGCPAGRNVKNGYMQTCINRVRLLNHQIVFMMFHGFIPDEIDHINQQVTDNRIENLRATNRSDNLKNRKKWKWGK